MSFVIVCSRLKTTTDYQDQNIRVHKMYKILALLSLTGRSGLILKGHVN